MSSSSIKVTKRKRAPKCANCGTENPSHNYKDCPEPCQICQESDHKTRSCPYYHIKNRHKRHMPDNDVSTSNDENNAGNNAENNNENNDSDPGDRGLRDTEEVLSENGVFALAAMTSAATFPANFKSIEVQKYQIKFKTVSGFEGTIDLHTNEEESRNIREQFQNVNINYVNRNSISSGGDIEYSIKPNEKSVPRGGGGGLDKIRKIGKFLSQAKYYKGIMPAKIPLRKTDISPADWRVEKYVMWGRQRIQRVIAKSDIESPEEDQSGSFKGSIFDDPPDVITVVRNWKKGKNTKTTYYRNPPKLELDQEDDNTSILSDYIEYLSEGLKYIQYNNEVN
jgi:hypothetical protein